jgi:hypothetical protein
MLQIYAVISVVLAFVGYVPYLRDTFTGITKPHIVSWFTWALVSFIAFGLQLSDGAGAGAFTNFSMGVICLVVGIRGLQNGTKDIKKQDLIALGLAIISIILWLVVKQPVLSIILVVMIDLFSFVPTIIKSWEKPWQETLFTWLVGTVRHIFTIFSLANISIITILYPLYSLIINSLFCTLLIFRRKALVKPTS